ncbi:MAG: phosphate/phosphite/phosphonate ABC transporter substrate-binding protein [Candidatus Riflebacteria bacterium]|nr:phosphate/phosphite/phosphonate ABC transporter substrate-binding protein [Candidatus Riflebacteria bacterium]
MGSKSFCLAFVALVLMGTVARAAGPSAAEQPLRMGCVAFAKEATREAYTQIADYLKGQLKREIVLTVYPSYHEVVHDIVNDKLDLAIMSPLVYLHALDERPLHTLAYASYRGSGRFTYRSVMLVRGDSPIGSLADLAGKTVAFVDIMSASGYLVPKEALVKAGVTGAKNVKGSFFKNHFDAVQAVLSGKADGVATYDLVFNDSKRLAVEQKKLKTVWASEFVIPSDAFVAIDSVPLAVRQQLRGALLSYFAVQEQKQCPSNNIYEGFVPADPNVYADLKRFIQSVSSK